MITIDGSFGEGGGQILRTAVAIASIIGEPIKIYNIRAKRPNPGLKRQHITAISAAAALTNAVVEGLDLGSKEITYKPSTIKSGRFKFNIGTAGSITLVLQTLLPIMVYAPSSVEVEITGGTDVPWSPPIDYVSNVIAPNLRKMGYSFDLKLLRRGHYPRGGGKVLVKVDKPPRQLHSISAVRRGEVHFIKGKSHCVRLPKHVAERQAKSAENYLRRNGINVPIEISLEWYRPNEDPHLGPGSGIVLWAIADNSVFGGDSIGARGKRAEVVGEEAAASLLKTLSTGYALDPHMGDNILPYIALAKGESTIGVSELTMHAYTNIWLIKKLLRVSVELEGELGGPFKLKVKGIGWTA